MTMSIFYDVFAKKKFKSVSIKQVKTYFFLVLQITHSQLVSINATKKIDKFLVP